MQLTFIVADTTNDIPEPHVERSKSARFPRDGECYSLLFEITPDEEYKGDGTFKEKKKNS